MENLGIGAGLGALGLWAFIGAIVLGGIWDGARKREAQHETLRRIIESGQSIDQELIDNLLGVKKRVDRDLKVSGLIVLFVSPGLATFAWVLSLLAPAALFPLLGAAGLVGFVGIGLLVASKFMERAYREDDASGSRSSMA